MPDTKCDKLIYLLVLLSVICLFGTSCGENDDHISNSVSLEHYLEVKPSKGFLDNAVVTVKGSTLSQEFGTDLSIPIMYFTQLMGMALGLQTKRLGIEKSTIAGMPMLAFA